MTTRRQFLKTSAAILISGVPLWGTGDAPAANQPAPVRGLHFYNSDGWPSVTAVAFHSNLWGLGNSTAGYDALMMPHMRKAKFDHSHFKELNKYSQFNDFAGRSDVFVALAHPEDPASLNQAIDHCALAKTAGALTILLAAEAFPDPERDQTEILKIFDRDLLFSGSARPDAIFRFQTLEPYMEMANVAKLFALHHECLHNVDLGDIRSVFSGQFDSIKLEGMAYGRHRARMAAAEACRHIKCGSLIERPIKGAYISTVVYGNWHIREFFAVYDVFRSKLPLDSTVIMAVVPAGQESEFFGVTALVTI